ncbi:MAG: zinc ribbon domain-containing protein [Clostridiales bacterium]|nr:zinc ribbon domain-containing protein [Clostridiales bacterium]
MFCVECGAKIEEKVEFCPNCGKAVFGGGDINKRDYVSEGKDMFKKMQNGSFWISGMRIIAWVCAGLIVLGGLITFITMAASYYGSGAMGFFVFLASIVAAFISVAAIMIFLDLARDVSEIKIALLKKQNE